MTRKKYSGRRADSRIRPIKAVARSSPKYIADLEKELHTMAETDRVVPTFPPVADRPLSYVRTLAEQNEKAIDTLRDRVGILMDRIERLEVLVPKGKEGRDTISSLLVDFLKRYKGIRFNTGTLSANVEGATASNVNTLLRGIMSYEHHIKSHKQEGQSAVYWWEDGEENE